MLDRHLCDPFQLLLGKNRARRVVRIAEDDHPAPWGEPLFQFPFGRPKPLLGEGDGNRGCPHDTGIPVIEPVGGRVDKDLVPWIDKPCIGEKDSLGGPIEHQDLIRAPPRIQVPGEHFRNRDPEFLFAIVGAVMGVALLHRLDRRLSNVLRGVKARISHIEIGDIVSPDRGELSGTLIIQHSGKQL